MRIAFIEAWLGSHDVQAGVSADEERNMPATYGALFAPECQAEMESLLQAAIASIRGKTFYRCGDELNACMFLQEIVATALWKHRCVVGERLESFARKYDRLDTLQERRELHFEAQQS
jgi:hypothetical protein